jgi:spermidine/putrescine-binding protein
MLFRELKTEWATLDPDQKAYGAALLANGQDWDVWRPHDWFPSHECPQGLIREQLTAICHGLPAAPRLVAK